MIDFSSIKAVTIPEGEVRQIAVDGVTVWKQRKQWDYIWDYTMGAPDTSLWDYPIGTGSVSLVGDEGLHFTATSSSAYAGLRFKDYAAWLGQKAVYEVEVKVISASGNGFRIVCASGSNGVSDNHGLQVTLNGNYLNVPTGKHGIGILTKTAPVTYGEWHKVRLELDIPTSSNKVYLDDTLVATVVTADLSTNYASSVWCLIQQGDCYVRAVRYRKDG